MRIEVIGGENSTIVQARAYAEYRLFATLARYARRIRSVNVVLGEVERKGASDRVTCAVKVILEPSWAIRVRAQGPHARGAIDRAAERVGDLLKRKTPPAISS